MLLKVVETRFNVFLVCLLAVLVTACGSAGGGNPTETSGKPHVVFLISEDTLNYEAHLTIPPFADSLQRTGGYETTVLLGKGPHAAFEFDGLDALRSADLLVVFCRRVGLPYEQMQLIRDYMQAGKPVIGIRTANHGFSVRGENTQKGYEGWWGFVPDILGAENRGYEPEELGTLVNVNSQQQQHPILAGIPDAAWQLNGAVYKVAPLIDPEAAVLLTGSTPNTSEPVAWVRQNHYGGKVFYTSLGYPTDFGHEPFRQLLVNAIRWTTE